MHIYNAQTREQRIPFEVARDNFNAETLEAFREVEEMKKNSSNVKTYDSFSDVLKVGGRK